MFEHSDLALSMLVLFRADHFAGLTSGAAAISAEHCRSSYEAEGQAQNADHVRV